jgi:hypothetical protein
MAAEERWVAGGNENNYGAKNRATQHADAHENERGDSEREVRADLSKNDHADRGHCERGHLRFAHRGWHPKALTGGVDQLRCSHEGDARESSR